MLKYSAMEKELIYLDNNASTRTAPEVLEEMLPYLRDFYANPSSAHSFGRAIKPKIDEARARVAALIGAEPDEIVFTGSGTESDNAAIFSAIATNPGGQIITTSVEHNAVLNPAKHLEAEGAPLKIVGVNSGGRLDIEGLKAALKKKTSVVSVMYANNETGVIFPIRQVSELVRSAGAIFHTDAVQAVGKVPVDVKKLGIDMLSLSGHKIHAPKGVGALYVRAGLSFHPMLRGGGQEHGRRAGTENVASIIGLGKACELAMKNMKRESAEISALRDTLEKGILSSCPGARVNGAVDNRLPNTSNISFEAIEGEAVLMMLDHYGICVSTGSACASSSHEPSHVLTAMRIPETHIHGTIRFSLGSFNTKAEIEKTLALIPGIIKMLREISVIQPG